MKIRGAALSDAASIAAIYNHFVTTSTITFEETEVSSGEMVNRIENVQAAGLPWHVATDEDNLVGYAYATPWKARSAYRYAVEVTVYVTPARFGTGIGTALYGKLLPALQQQNIHTALAAIALPNPGSIALHERCGFRKAAHFHQVGFKMQRWIDVGYWQLVFG